MLAAAELVWLLAAVAKGDEAAFESLYQATQAKLYGVTLRILRQPDLADEVMQETYVRIWNHAGDYNPREMAPILWMVAMARSHAIDVVRKQSDGLIEDEPRGFDGDAEEHGAVAQDAMTDSLRRLLACMGQLDEEHRRALLLAYYNGWSRDQLAEKFGQPTPIIKDWLRRGLVQIRECLAP